MTNNLAANGLSQAGILQKEGLKLQLEILSILEHTKCEFEKILNTKSETIVYE
jgi:hypothetical protein